MASRKVCSYCSQELSHTTFYRHLNDTSGTICPARKRSRSYANLPDTEAELTPVDKITRGDSLSLDSSFDVNSDYDCETWQDAE